MDKTPKLATCGDYRPRQIALILIDKRSWLFFYRV